MLLDLAAQLRQAELFHGGLDFLKQAALLAADVLIQKLAKGDERFLALLAPLGGERLDHSLHFAVLSDQHVNQRVVFDQRPNGGKQNLFLHPKMAEQLNLGHVGDHLA